MDIKDKIIQLIAAADKAITEERFDDLMDFYTDDAVLVIKPGREAHGKDQIKQAFIAIAAYFNNSVKPSQGKMEIIEAGDTALVLSQTFVEAAAKADSEYPSERRATYVYRLVDGKWLCAVDNSYGTALLD